MGKKNIIGLACQPSRGNSCHTQIAHNIISQCSLLDNTKKPDRLNLSGKFLIGAENEIRTRDPLLGKEVLYH